MLASQPSRWVPNGATPRRVGTWEQPEFGLCLPTAHPVAATVRVGAVGTRSMLDNSLQTARIRVLRAADPTLRSLRRRSTKQRRARRTGDTGYAAHGYNESSSAAAPPRNWAVSGRAKQSPHRPETAGNGPPLRQCLALPGSKLATALQHVGHRWAPSCSRFIDGWPGAASCRTRAWQLSESLRRLSAGAFAPRVCVSAPPPLAQGRFLVPAMPAHCTVLFLHCREHVSACKLTKSPSLLKCALR